MTKAAIKREKQLRERLTNVLNAKLIDFKDMYLSCYVDWSKESIKTRIHNLKKENGQTYKVEGKWAHTKTIDNTSKIERLKIELSRDMILTLKFVNEASEGYNVKIEKLIEKLVKANIDIYKLKVEKMGDVGSEFAFLISDEKVEVHARVIFANGSINAPHFRFITTQRKK